MYKCFFKRFFDFWISLFFIISLSPILLVVTIWLHFANKGAGVFFFQERPGKGGKIFKVIKFKTMTDECDEKGKRLPDAQRLTKVGRFVRSLSLDELPQLFNVLKGDMALIGPRPLLVQYLPFYTPEQARRHEVRPGISGWAQVHGRNHCKLSKKFELDVWYVDHCSFVTDLRIIWITLMNVIKRSDVGEGSGDMKEVDDIHMSERVKVLREQKAKLGEKRLLILGGDAASCDIVKAAKAMGVYTIVTDWYDTKTSPAKLIADEYWNDSILDYETLVSKIKDNHVEGIITGFTDSYLLPYQHLCELTGLPCYATQEVFELTMDKARFKQLCRDHGVPVIPEYQLSDFTPDTITPENKVIIKPVDNSGSRGVILCHKPEDFDSCLQYALSFSKKKEVVIEKYMEMDSVSASYTIQDGVISLSTLNDRYVHKSADGGAVTCLSIYPSKYAEQYISQLNDKVRSMFVNAGVRNGLLSLQFFTDGNDFYAMEMGHRLTGGQHYTYSKMENGVSSLDCLIHYALTGSMADFDISKKENAKFNHVYCHLYILGKEAKIARVDGWDYLERMPQMMRISKMKDVGDTIGRDGTSAQKIVGLHLMINAIAEMEQVLTDIRNHFHVYDEEGNDLVLELGK